MTAVFTIDLCRIFREIIAPAVKVPQHIVNARRQQLAAWMQQHGHASLQEICAQFGVSEATARRDLSALAADKQLVRTYGGALVEHNHRFASFRERREKSARAKARIAARAHRWIRPNSCIYFDAGTTIYAIAEELVRRPVEPLTVVTNSLPVADILAAVPRLRLHLLGGALLPRQSVLIGEMAGKALQFYKIDVAFMGAQAADERGLWNSQAEVVAFQRRLLETAGMAVFCLDETKLGHQGPVFLAQWNEVETLVTNASRKRLEALGIPEAGKAIVQSDA